MFEKLSLLLASGSPAFTHWVHRILVLLAMVTGYFTYKGASLGAVNFDDHATSTVFAIGSGIAIFAFWALVFKSALDWESGKAKKLGLAVVGAGTLFILPLSSVYNAAGIDRGGVLEHHQTLFINDVSQTLDGIIESNKDLHGVIVEGRQLSGRYRGLGEAELNSGGTSGVGGTGAVQSALQGAADRLQKMVEEIEEFQRSSDRTLATAQLRMERIREVSGSARPIAERDRLIKNEVDLLRADFAKLDSDAVRQAVSRTVRALPREVRLAANYSRNSRTRRAQSDALDRLQEEISEAAQTLDAAVTAKSGERIEIPAYEPISATRAIMLYWPQVIPQLAGGIAIDLTPLALLCFCLVSLGAKSREEIAGEALLQGTSVGDLLRIIALWDVLRNDKQSAPLMQQLYDLAFRDLKKD